MKKYDLANLKDVQDTPRFQKRLRRDASTDPDNIEKKRIEFAKHAVVIKEIIKLIQLNTAKQNELRLAMTQDRELDPDKRTRLMALEFENGQLFNTASLQSAVGLYDGLGLIVDSLTVALNERDKETKERTFFRIPAGDMLYDMAGEMENLNERMDILLRMTEDMGTRQRAFWKGRHTQDGEQDAGQLDAAILDGPAPAGVPEKDLLAARTATPEEVEKLVKGA